VHEVRRVLEVEIAGLAAQRRGEDDLAALRGALQELDAAAGDHARWAAADVAFHASVAIATHNPLHPVLLDSMAGLLTALRLSAAALPEAPMLARAHHTAIFAAIEAGSRADARRAMTAHMAEAESTFRRARLVEGFKPIG